MTVKFNAQRYIVSFDVCYVSIQPKRVPCAYIKGITVDLPGREI